MCDLCAELTTALDDNCQLRVDLLHAYAESGHDSDERTLQKLCWRQLGTPFSSAAQDFRIAALFKCIGVDEAAQRTNK